MRVGRGICCRNELAPGTIGALLVLIPETGAAFDEPGEYMPTAVLLGAGLSARELSARANDDGALGEVLRLA